MIKLSFFIAKSFTNLILVVVIVLGCIFVAPKIILLFMPFIIGWFLALLANPLVRFFEEKIKMLNKINETIKDTKEAEEVVEEEPAQEKTEETNSGECWALVCYTEKTMFQKITYNLKKLFNYAKERILGRA